MTLEDARWMARLLNQLSPEQLHAALAAAGFTPALVSCYESKLIARRNQMIRDLHLGEEMKQAANGS